MIEILTYVRYGLVCLIPVFILVGIYFGIKQSLDIKYRKKAIKALILIIALPILIVLMNILLENLILNDIKEKVKDANLSNSEIVINNKQTDLTIKEINDLISNMDYNGHLRNRTADLECYKITIKNKDNYSFSLYRNGREKTLFRLYTNEYNYESELSYVKTTIFE